MCSIENKNEWRKSKLVILAVLPLFSKLDIHKLSLFHENRLVKGKWTGRRLLNSSFKVINPMKTCPKTKIGWTCDSLKEKHGQTRLSKTTEFTFFRKLIKKVANKYISGRKFGEQVILKKLLHTNCMIATWGHWEWQMFEFALLATTGARSFNKNWYQFPAGFLPYRGLS